MLGVGVSDSYKDGLLLLAHCNPLDLSEFSALMNNEHEGVPYDAFYKPFGYSNLNEVQPILGVQTSFSDSNVAASTPGLIYQPPQTSWQSWQGRHLNFRAW